MNHRRSRVFAVTVLASLLVIGLAPSAVAKGPTEAVITGPGLTQPIALRWPDAPTDGADLASLVRHSGFFVGTFGGVRSRGHLAYEPAGPLGPRYTITYTMAFPEKPSSEIVQYVYPYAEPRVVTFMPAGQPFWDGNETAGGWFASRVDFKQTLIQLGLPATAPIIPPAGGGGTAGSIPDPASSDSLAVPLLIAGVLLAVGLAMVVAARRRAGGASPGSPLVGTSDHR